ncbi:phosphatase PAP2 family protein [Streptomyces jeddahensis]|uniref:Extracellular serine protease n=1 Tax=Streptomyces jeddahensis TaxID=1716141 RepID=A0A177HJJ8_9ACTN|nr:phosphatase PAP2 family protein [Streptomyces jeddahensis]OAH11152.1 extracellular serine protease precursor [Streptomyces jeddahensis]
MTARTPKVGVDGARMDRRSLDRRSFLKRSAGLSAGLIAGPAALAWLPGQQAHAAEASQAATVRAFVDDYLTNTADNLTPETNAAVRILSGMQRLWETGTAWNNGTPLAADVLRANMRYSIALTTRRTDEQARQSFIYDRQDQSYAATAGLGPLTEVYRTGAKAVTSITSAPDGTPAGKVSDGVPAGAPAGSAIGAGAPDSELGKVVQLVQTLRGPHASSNPGKFAYQYPRPWRMTEDNEVVDTGATDAFGFPVYKSDVVVAPQLLRQRSTTPAEDGGYPSGHTNALYLAALALAYAIPERFQELVAHASAASHTRILSGMHSALDVMGGRILATALAAAALYDPANAGLKAAARQQAAAYLQAQTGTTADTLYAYAHSAGTDTDPYADRAANERAVTPRLTYILPRQGDGRVPMTVPKGAEVLVETRLPYLTADQRREVLRTTALPSGYALLDGPEQWGRLNLFAAADGYGAFDGDVRVDLDASAGGFHAADAWRNDIGGRGSLTKLGTGSLTLTGANRYSGGTSVEAGTLVAASRDALGAGDVQVRGGSLRLTAGDGVRVRGSYGQASGATLDVAVGDCGGPALTVSGSAVLARGSALELRVDDPAEGTVIQVLRARGGLRGRFGTITVRAEGRTYEAVPTYSANGVSVRLK